MMYEERIPKSSESVVARTGKLTRTHHDSGFVVERERERGERNEEQKNENDKT